MTAVTSTEVESVANRPLTEIERQQRVTAALGDDFLFPLFNGRQAIESQRKSGYKSTARAAREIIDNAFEAGAKNAWVAFRRAGEAGRGKYDRKDAVTAIAFIDDGPGMVPVMARYALSWGGGSHFDNPTGIGRFGFGLPNSSINQTRRVEVYTRTDPGQPWIRVTLDITPEKLEKLPASGLVQVAPHEEDVALPDFVSEYLSRNKIELGSGTIVVWDKPDRLSAKSAGKLKEYMLDDFGVVYRYLLDEGRFQITVDGTAVQLVDPLFLMKNGRYFLPSDKGGAAVSYERNLSVKHTREPGSGVQHLELLASADEIRAAKAEAASNPLMSVGTMTVTIARFPYGFAAKTTKSDRAGGGAGIKDPDSSKRLQIRAKRRGITFVRANREIDTVDVFPTSETDKANGLGSWPTLQGYAFHWGVEVRFSPNLDEIMGIGNDKQTVNPAEDFWRVLAEAEVDRALREENRFQLQTRKRVEEAAAEEEAKDPDKPNPATEAAAEAETLMGRPMTMPTDRASEPEASKTGTGSTDAGPTATDTPDAGTTGTTTADTGTTSGPAATGAAGGDKSGPPPAQTVAYRIGFFTSEGGVFYKPDFGPNLQRVALINTAHPFFKVFYVELMKIKNPKARQAIDLLLLSLAKAELFADDRTKRVYQHQRESEWSPFLKLGLGILDDMQATDPEEAEEDVEDEPEAT